MKKVQKKDEKSAKKDEKSAKKAYAYAFKIACN